MNKNKDVVHSKKSLQGDCHVWSVNLPKGAVPFEQKDNCLAYGEVTGHAHRIHGTVEFFKWQAKTYFRVPAGAPVALKHEEHNPIILPPGDYEYGNTLEFNYDEMESRRVAD